MKYEGFRKASNYFNLMNTEDHIYKDILEGSAAVDYMAEMEASFKSDGPDGCIMSNHLIGEFYDGAKMFDNRLNNFHALIIQLINLPPTYRVKNGSGSFVIASHTLSADSPGERAIMSKLFVADLEYLRKGFIRKVGNMKFWVQARLNHHMWDTIALAANACVKVNNAKGACVICGGIKGTYRHCLKHTVYLGHRRLLPINHRLRWYGSSKRCCPAGYHDGDLEMEREINVMFNDVTLDPVQNFPVTAHYSNYRSGVSSGCDFPANQLKKEMQKGSYYVRERGTMELRKGNSNNMWFHEKEFPFEETGFHDYVSYPHLDLRKEPSIEHIKNETFDEWGVQAFITGQPCNNVHKPWPFKGISKWDHVNWEPFHAISNVCKNLIDLLDGSRGNSISVRKLCKAQNVHPCLWSPHMNTVPFWEMTENERDLADAVMSCIILPFGWKSSCQVLNPFRQTGFLSGVQMINFVTIYLPLLVTMSSNLRPEYKCFISMLATDIADLQSFRVSDDDVFWLTNKLMELVALKEGLFPDSEAKVVWHQLTDLPYHIYTMGPVPCWWALFGEREIGSLKRSIL